MKVFKTPKLWKKKRQELSGSLGFVPTLGGLHKGHLSLVRKSLEDNDHTVVSIFLNPHQFNDKEDFNNYPCSFKKDLEVLKSLGDVFIFAPSEEDMYPDDYRFSIKEKQISRMMCGASRPGFFEGVMTIVFKLFQIISPHRAYFGEKDYQQYLLISHMVKAFFMDVDIVHCPTVRDEKGLALSSRNELLTEGEKKKASQLYEALRGCASSEEVKQKLLEEGFQVDFVEEHFKRRFGAVFLGPVRLIDNISLKEVLK